MKKGVLLVNLGTPDDPSRGAVYRYLKQFLLDPRVIDINWLSRNLLVRGMIAPFRSANSSKLYKMLWTDRGSPLKYWGQELAKGVQQSLGDDYLIELGMRYQHPSIASALNKLLKANVSELTILPLFPQYASASTGSVYEEVMRLLSSEQGIPPLRIINSFYDNEAMIEVFAANAQKHDLKVYDHFIFSFHGLPQRQLKKTDRSGSHCLASDDCCKSICAKNQFCYSAQCHATARAIQKQLSLAPEVCSVSFQSRLGKDPWVQPYTTDVLMQRRDAGDERILMFSPAFVADCLETTVEIEYEYREEFIDAGGVQLDLVQSLNGEPQWIKAVAKMVK